MALVTKSLPDEFFETMADGAQTHQPAHVADHDPFVNRIRNETDLGQQRRLGFGHAMRAAGMNELPPAVVC
jgi:ribose transport system substrate-binding protein